MIFTLPRKTEMLWQMRCVFVIAFLCFLATSFLPVIFKTVVLILLLGFGAFFVFVYIPMFFKSYTITICKKNIVVNKGFIIKTRILLSKERITVIKSLSTPTTMLLKLRTIIIKTPRYTLLIPAIDKKRALILLCGITDD